MSFTIKLKSDNSSLLSTEKTLVTSLLFKWKASVALLTATKNSLMKTARWHHCPSTGVIQTLGHQVPFQLRVTKFLFHHVNGLSMISKILQFSSKSPSMVDSHSRIPLMNQPIGLLILSSCTSELVSFGSVLKIVHIKEMPPSSSLVILILRLSLQVLWLSLVTRVFSSSMKPNFTVSLVTA